MLEAVTNAINTVLNWIGTFVQSLIGTPAEGSTAGILAPLLPLFAIGIAISAVMLGVKIVKSVVWGA